MIQSVSWNRVCLQCCDVHVGVFGAGSVFKSGNKGCHSRCAGTRLTAILVICMWGFLVQEAVAGVGGSHFESPRHGGIL